jgi:hypothetical protein
MSVPSVTYYMDEAGDSVLFGSMGRDRLSDPEAPRFFMLGMVRCGDDVDVARRLAELRGSLQSNPLYSTIPSLRPEAQKTSRAFHAKDDHPEIRSKVFELLVTLDFRFYAVVKSMHAVRDEVRRRNLKDANDRYHPNELYARMVRMLFKLQLDQEDHCQVVFARRGTSDRTRALAKEMDDARKQFLAGDRVARPRTLEIHPAYPWQRPCIQVADYCLWALQRCYDRSEGRFLNALWPKVSLIHDVDDPDVVAYGSYWTWKGPPLEPEKIKSRWI